MLCWVSVVRYLKTKDVHGIQGGRDGRGEGGGPGRGADIPGSFGDQDPYS